MDEDKVHLKFLSYKEEESGRKAIKRQHSVESVNSEEESKSKPDVKSKDKQKAEETQETTKKKRKKIVDKKNSDKEQSKELSNEPTTGSHNSTDEVCKKNPSIKCYQDVLIFTSWYLKNHELYLILCSVLKKPVFYIPHFLLILSEHKPK